VILDTSPELLNPGEAVFDDTRTYRYTLTRTWNPGLPPVTWIMLNQSTADALSDDPTIRRCRSFASREGGGGIIVVNLFAYRATHPADLAIAADPVGTRNDEFIREACGDGLVIAGWGAHPHPATAARVTAVAGMLTACGVKLHCLGLTRDGHPRHPLYAPGNAPLIRWEQQ